MFVEGCSGATDKAGESYSYEGACVSEDAAEDSGGYCSDGAGPEFPGVKQPFFSS